MRKFSHKAMDTEFSVSFGLNEDEALCGAAAAACFARIDGLELLLTRFNDTSDVAVIRGLPDGGIATVARETMDVLVASARVCAATGGAFDPTVERRNFAELTLDVEHVRVGVRKGPVALDFGGIGKGYALDVCARPFPEGRDRRVFLDLWQHPWAVARYYRVEPFSKQHEAKMRPLWEQLADAGQKVITATIMDRPWAHQCFDAYRSMVRHIRTADGGWRFDYTVFDRYVAFARACGLGPQIHCYTLCPFRLKRYYWEDEKGTACFGDFEVGSPEFVDYWRAFLEDFAAHLKAKGLFETTYIALDERSPAELKTACDLVKRHGGMKIAMAGDRPPSQFDGIEIDNFSIALQFVTPAYLAEAGARRARGRTTTVYVAGGNPCTGTAQPPIDCTWLGVYPGAVDLDGFLRWAYCSWPANPNSDTTYWPWFGRWAAGGTYLVYPDGPSLRFLALRNGLNLSEKIQRLRAEGRLDAALAATLKEFDYKGPKDYPPPPVTEDLLRRTAARVHAAATRP